MTEMFKNKQSHPAYALVQFNRVTSSHGEVLFGSSIKPHSYIELVIREAEVTHELAKDWYFGTKEVVKIKLSPAQFAELLTTMNVGSGVPCTIDHINGERPPRLTEIDVNKETNKIIDTIEKQAQEVVKPMHDFSNRINELRESGKISKKTAEEISGHFFKMEQELRANLPFYLEQVNKTAEKVLVSKKAELDSFVTGMVTKLGMEKLEDLKLLAGTNEGALHIDKKE